MVLISDRPDKTNGMFWLLQHCATVYPQVRGIFQAAASVTSVVASCNLAKDLQNMASTAPLGLKSPQTAAKT